MNAPAAPPPVFFESAAAFRAWLASNADSAPEIVVGYRKVGTGLASMTWSESVDEALCFGWIDGVRRRIDERSYQIRFTPRRPGSTWSAVNIAKVAALTAQGRMQPAGVAAFALRTEARSRTYSYENDAPAELSKDEIRQFKKHRSAWNHFNAAAPSTRRTLVRWVSAAKQPATRLRRFARLLAACDAGEPLR